MCCFFVIVGDFEGIFVVSKFGFVVYVLYFSCLYMFCVSVLYE